MYSMSKIGASLFLLMTGGLLVVPVILKGKQGNSSPSNRSHLGFDLNVFPGKAALPVLRKTFSFSGYWLSPPPGEKTNSWTGRRELLLAQRFGFLLLYRGRESRGLKNGADAAQKGTLDARNAALAAKKDGFPRHAVIFLDIEEGGRLPAAYHAYLRAWTAALAADGYRSGAYCSGMPVKEGPSATITTADDIHAHSPSPDFVFFLYNDACPPAPGCTFPQDPPAPSVGGAPFASVWQYAQSPRRKEFTAQCAPGYHADGNCYAPGDTAHSWFLDVETATTADPSSASIPSN